MSARFLTDFEKPVKAGTYPAEVCVLVDGATPGPLYALLSYYNAAGTLLEIASSIINQQDFGGMVRIELNNDYLQEAAYFDLQLSTTDDKTATSPNDRVTHAPEIAEALPRFLTETVDGLINGSYRNELSILVEAEAPEPLYFERRYLDGAGQQVEIRATLIPKALYGGRVNFTLNENWLHCAVAVEFSVQSTLRAFAGYCPGDTPPTGIFDSTFDFTFE